MVADNVRDFERYINQKYKKQLGNRPITVYLIPTTRDLMLQKVADGLGDIAAGNLTATDERKKVVDFVAPADQRPISELVVTGPKSPSIASADDLSGKTVHVRKSSSYYESLKALNSRLQKEGKPAVNLMAVPDALEDEDMMEMLNVGLLEAIVADDWKAKIWAKLLPKVRVNEGAVVWSGGLIGWGIRKGSPQLAAELNDYYVNFMKKHGTLNWRRLEYYKQIKQITNSAGSAEVKRFRPSLKVSVYHGPGRALDEAADVTLTTYALMRLDAEVLGAKQWNTVVLDEAQAIKNPDSQVARAAYGLQADFKLALSGTPVENHLGELWSLFEFLNPGMLGTASVFGLADNSKNPDEETRRLLARALRPFILRRTKQQVARDLPSKLEQTLYCELKAEQRRQYDDLKEHYRQTLLGRIETEGLQKAKIHVLEALLRLRQAACHPGLLDKKHIANPSAQERLKLGDELERSPPLMVSPESPGDSNRPR